MNDNIFLGSKILFLEKGIEAWLKLDQTRRGGCS